MDAVRPWLLVGKLAETLNLDLLRYMGVEAMLQLCQEVRQPTIITCFLPVEDGEPLARTALVDGIRFIREQPVLWQSLCDYYGETAPLNDMVKLSRPVRWQ